MPSPSPPELLIVLERQAKLCEDLEAVADGLPIRVDPGHCLRVAMQILPVLQESQRAEEMRLFPGLLARSPNAMAIVSHLRTEHAEDQGFGEEVRAELIDLSRGHSSLPPEALVYMLRGFFEGMRRHMRHVREVCETISVS